MDVGKSLQSLRRSVSKNRTDCSTGTVFLDFIQSYVLLALKFSGGDYSAKDVSPYVEETFTELMEKWIKAHWKVDC